MKLVSYKTTTDNERLGIFYNEHIYDVADSAQSLSLRLPSMMNEFLMLAEEGMNTARNVYDAIVAEKVAPVKTGDLVLPLLAPVPHPTSCRDAYAFRQHVATARRNRGVEMIQEFDQFPVFYFTNHQAIFGEGQVVVEQDHLQKLDFELEAAVVIGKRGKNISAKDADRYIAGYMIMNDLSARVLQMEEMKLNLGPAKGKDFATTLGPWLVTPDELEPYKIETECGATYNLRMTARHNGRQISEGNLKDMNWTFAEIIERCSYGVELYPGGVIGSGTVGTGCYLELNGTWALEAKAKGETHTPVWLEDGDTIELEIDGLGVLRNTIKKADHNYSILAKKKQTAAV